MIANCPCGQPATIDAGGDVRDEHGNRSKLCPACAYGRARPPATQPKQPIIVTVLSEIGRNQAAKNQGETK